MTYEQILARQPASYLAGNIAVAAEFVVFLTGVTQSSDMDAFDDSQKNYIYRLLARWKKRAEGKDLRWNVVGDRPGRPPRKTHIRRNVIHNDPSEDTPLFRSLYAKFGDSKELP